MPYLVYLYSTCSEAWHGKAMPGPTLQRITCMHFHGSKTLAHARCAPKEAQTEVTSPQHTPCAGPRLRGPCIVPAAGQSHYVGLERMPITQPAKGDREEVRWMARPRGGRRAAGDGGLSPRLCDAATSPFQPKAVVQLLALIPIVHFPSHSKKTKGGTS